MLAKIISAGALTLLLSGGALADQPHKIYAGHSHSAQPRQNLHLNALALGSGSTLHSQRGASSQHNPMPVTAIAPPNDRQPIPHRMGIDGYSEPNST
jgi:hypothetical protein